MTGTPQDPRSDLPRHPLRVVSQRTGLSGHVLRAWERRYGVIAPDRTEGGQRLYSDADVERLLLLRSLTDGGYAIGQLAPLPFEELARLAAQQPKTVPLAAEVSEGGNRELREGDEQAAEVRAALFAAIERFDSPSLLQGLERSAVAMGLPRFLDEVMGPLLTEIGVRWSEGRLGIAHEHLATAVVRRVLGWARETAERSGPGPMLVVATPARQLHEGGALLVAATAAAEGWHVTYLGADLPAAEIADAARRTDARAVALSLIHPDDDQGLGPELRALRAALPTAIPILVGGSASTGYRDALATIRARIVPDLPALRHTLRALAASPHSRP